MDQYEVICNISNELRTYTPDVRILTTYYAGQYTSILGLIYDKAEFFS
jgi:hypothetical protein